MDVCVLTSDRIFFSAVEGMAGAMGHSARQAEKLTEVGAADVIVADFGSSPFDFECLTAAADPLRTILFAPEKKAEILSEARANGIAHVHSRGDLLVELPPLLDLYA